MRAALPRAILITLLCAGLCATAPANAKGKKIVVKGFKAPESTIHDAVADVYLVANIGKGGDPSAKDGNGFISAVTPDGRVLERHRIGGKGSKTKLHAPKGMAITGDTLWVADIDVLRRFDRVTAAWKGDVKISGAVFLNDVAAAPDGSVYVTDTGFGGSGRKDAIYHVTADGQVKKVVSGASLKRPNGIVVTAEGDLAVASMDAPRIYRVSKTGALGARIKTPGRDLDGLELLEDGSFLVSSWEKTSVYRVLPDGTTKRLVKGILSPAGIGFDAKRSRLLVPNLEKNRLELYDLSL